MSSSGEAESLCWSNESEEQMHLAKHSFEDMFLSHVSYFPLHPKCTWSPGDLPVLHPQLHLSYPSPRHTNTQAGAPSYVS